ncbi:response regulator [Romeria aff. gracilis LEGE 07310]|uniref:Response regulator n=1 Tax=Vasconcelosia minhoensis LEGE 07310 TaxID=915328 RepID=A0A8J7AJ24_9CYAN|nr:response regulator [Romeria gracilis]MBE9078493.1 response regulator [Romeria aff. gracilis LEGE 07310]
MAKKILVIEDEAQTRGMFLRCLAFEDFQAFGAENGVVGVELARTHLPDLIVCDIMMPDMDGYAVLSTLHQAQETASIPLIFLTAKATLADLRSGMSLGADDYLTKPCTIEQFLAAITTRLKRKAALANPLHAAPESQPNQAEVSPNAAVSPPEPESIFPHCPQLNSVFEFIEQHYQEPINIDAVAAAAGYSSPYLTHLLHTQTGRTIKRWIIERRMVQARFLLANTDQPIRAIAEAAGYSDAGYFSRQFRKMHSMTPQTWREKL